MYSHKYPVKPCKPVSKAPLKLVRLLDQVRERIRYCRHIAGNFMPTARISNTNAYVE